MSPALRPWPSGRCLLPACDMLEHSSHETLQMIISNIRDLPSWKGQTVLIPFYQENKDQALKPKPADGNLRSPWGRKWATSWCYSWPQWLLYESSRKDGCPLPSLSPSSVRGIKHKTMPLQAPGRTLRTQVKAGYSVTSLPPVLQPSAPGTPPPRQMLVGCYC